MIFQSKVTNPRDYGISGSYEKWILWLTWVKLKLALVWAKVKQSLLMQRCRRGSNKKRIIYLIWHSCKPIPCRPGLPRRKLLNRLESASRGLWCDEGPGLRQYRQQTPHSSGLVYWHKSSRELKNKSIYGYTAKLLSSICPQQSLLLDRRSIDLSGAQEKEGHCQYNNFLRALKWGITCHTCSIIPKSLYWGLGLSGL